MKTVSNILTRKGSSVIAIDGSTTVLDALKLMADKNIGSVVITENGVYTGLLTERDYARKVILQGKSSLQTQVREIMSTGLPRVLPDNSVETCMHIMSESNLRYLPVFKNDSLCGIISISDVVTETIMTHEENYRAFEKLYSIVRAYQDLLNTQINGRFLNCLLLSLLSTVTNNSLVPGGAIPLP